MYRKHRPDGIGRIGFLVATGVLMLCAVDASAQEAILIDHRSADLSKVPASWVQQAKAQFRISYGHTSHGSQIITGLEGLRYPAGSLYWWDEDGTLGGLSLHDCTDLWGDLGHYGDLTWEQLTRDLLDSPGCDRNMILWSWCGGVSDNTAEGINIYLNAMNQLELDYPDVTFVYMSGHLDGTGEEGNLHIRNNQIRDYCRTHGKVLFDFADIESYDPDGDYFLDLYCNDNCDYSGGNWAVQWCSAHPGDPLCASCSCAHSQPLNCNLKGRAFWWMMARLAGWDGLTGNADFDHDGDVDLQDYQNFAACLAGPGVTPAPTPPPTPPPTAAECLDAFDFNRDGDVDLGDFKAFQTAFGTP